MADKKTSTSSTAEPQPATADSALRSAVGQLTLVEHRMTKDASLALRREKANLEQTRAETG